MYMQSARLLVYILCMNSLTMSLLALFAGSAIAMQSGMSGQLGKILNNPLYASFVIYFSSLIFTIPALFIFKSQVPDLELLRSVPGHLWFTGGLLSVLALSSIYWLMPRLGVSGIMSLVLTGQIFAAMIAGHFGWFDLPLTPLNWRMSLGAILLVGGVFLINGGKTV